MRSSITKKIGVRLIALTIAPCAIFGLLIGCVGDRSKNSSNYKLTGTWEFKNQNGAKTGTAIFDSQNDLEGNVYILNAQSSGDLSLGNSSLSKIAIAGKFKVNSNTNPPQLDLIFGDLITQTIYEINNDGELKITNTVPEQPRPTIFDASPQRLIKISDGTTIANEIKILRSADLTDTSALIRTADSKSNIIAIMRSQQQIFQEKGVFSQNIKQVSTGLTLNPEFYKYQITILENGSLAQHSAIAVQDGLKAYTGIVYAIASNNQKTTKLLLCESNLPTKEIPAHPQNNPQDQDEKYRCPNGYTPFN